METGQPVWLVTRPDNATFVTTWPLPYQHIPEYTVTPVTVVRVTESGVKWEHVIPSRECLGTPEFTHGELTGVYGTCPQCGGYGHE